MTETNQFPRVLVVDDTPALLSIMEVILKQIPAEVTSANDGAKALDIVLSEMKKGKVFDLILMDVRMPVMDGEEATRKIREAGYTKPIVALTAYSNADELQSVADAFDAILNKPISLDKVREILSKTGGTSSV